MKEKNWLIENIKRSIKDAIIEGIYDTTATPYLSKTDAQREIGINPLRTDVGGHSSHDEVKQPSTFDRNGANFKGEHIVFSENKYIIYKVKNFGNPDVKDTLSFFGTGANGEKELRRAIDTLNGAAKRNGKTLSYRTITSEKNKSISERTGYMSKTFWEFSFDDENWYILKPNPVQSMKQSKLVRI